MTALKRARDLADLFPGSGTEVSDSLNRPGWFTWTAWSGPIVSYGQAETVDEADRRAKAALARCRAKADEVRERFDA